MKIFTATIFILSITAANIGLAHSGVLTNTAVMLGRSRITVMEEAQEGGKCYGEGEFWG